MHEACANSMRHILSHPVLAVYCQSRETHPLATSCASPGMLEALEDVSIDSAASLWAKRLPALFCADLSFCARLATAEALRGVLNARPMTSSLLSFLEAVAPVAATSATPKEEFAR